MDPVTSSDSRAGRQGRLRGRVYALLEAPDYLRQGRAGDRPSSGGSIIPEIFLVTVILLNTVSLILWTVPSLTSTYSLWFHLVEYGTVSVFVAEYVLRFWAAPEANAGASPWQQRWRFVVTPTSLIDAAAILPSLAAIVVVLISGDSLSLSFLLVLRLVTRSAQAGPLLSGRAPVGDGTATKGRPVAHRGGGVAGGFGHRRRPDVLRRVGVPAGGFQQHSGSHVVERSHPHHGGLRRHRAGDRHRAAAGGGDCGVGHRPCSPCRQAY